MKKVIMLIVLVCGLFAGSCATPLHDAARRGDTNAVKEMLDKGGNANEAIAPNNMTPLHSSIAWDRGDNSEIAKLLIEKGATVEWDASTCIGCPSVSALAFAAYYRKVKTMKVLIEHGADIDRAIIGLELPVSIGLMSNAAQRKYGVKLLERMKKEAEAAPSAPALAAPAFTSKKSDIDDLPMIKTPQNKNAYAIIIGIESYRQKLPKTDFAVSDAKIVAEYLEKVLGYPEKNVVTLTNDQAAKSDFEKYFERWLVNNVEKGSTVFVYFSGHGAPNPKTGDAYLVPYDGDPSFIAETGYSLKRMYDVLGKLPAKEIIVALDSCFSGAGGRSVLAKGARPLVMNLKTAAVPSKNMIVLAASSGDQISSTYDEKGHGLFTYFMLKGIKNEDVVKPDGSLSISDLYGYIKPQVERIARKQYNNEQSPQLIGAENR